MSNKTETFDPNQIMEHIQNQLQQAAASQPKHGMRNSQLTYPAKPADIPYNLTLYSHLHAAQTEMPNYDRELLIQPNAFTKIPIIGKVALAIQTHLHQIALFYVNRSLRHQLEMNQHLLTSIEQLTIEQQKQQRVIKNLQNQIQALQEKSAA